MVPSPGTLLPSTGSLGSVPRFRRYYQGAPTPRRSSRLAPVFPRSAVPRRVPLFAPAPAGRCTRGPGHLTAGALPSPATSDRGTDRASHVPWRTPLRGRRVLRPRTSRRARPYGTSVQPPPTFTTSAPSQSSISRLNHTAPHACCLRFAVRVAPHPRKTRFRLVASLYRVGLGTDQGSRREVSMPAAILDVHSTFPPPQGFMTHECRGALTAVAPSLRSPPAAPLAGEECGLLAREPAQGRRRVQAA